MSQFSRLFVFPFALLAAAAALHEIFRDDGTWFLSLRVKTLFCHTQGDLATSCYVVAPCRVVYVEKEGKRSSVALFFAESMSCSLVV